jgi:hypothetical protein
MFSSVRYNAELTLEGLKSLGLSGIMPEHVQQLDSLEHTHELQQVGQAMAKSVEIEHFVRFA